MLTPPAQRQATHPWEQSHQISKINSHETDMTFLRHDRDCFLVVAILVQTFIV